VEGVGSRFRQSPPSARTGLAGAIDSRPLFAVPVVSDYDFELPQHLIAQQPLARRSDARMMVVDRESATISHHRVRDLVEYLEPEDCLVVNNSRVAPARLVGYRTSTKGRWEGLFLSTAEDGQWRILGKARGHLVPDETVTLVNATARDELRLRLIAKEPGGVWLVRPEPLRPEPPATAWELLARVGRVPLPRYIRDGQMIESDIERYQTVYAEHPGSVAAPTAGLHFTNELLTRIRGRGTTVANVTLHVGLGTFRPIATERLEEHRMHSEWAQISAEACDAINRARQAGGRVVAVGTTSVRTLESAASHAEGVGSRFRSSDSSVPQAATAKSTPDPLALQPWSGETNLFIRPPYEFRVVGAMLTNFHLPRSTLLVLVRTFGGDELIRRAYAEAISEEYRFFSYGDAMLIL
jgi:S-adenosylmethionine:tRNA ribosyltransferase-isomerase